MKCAGRDFKWQGDLEVGTARRLGMVVGDFKTAGGLGTAWRLQTARGLGTARRLGTARAGDLEWQLQVETSHSRETWRVWKYHIEKRKIEKK